jgi:hypothetical protein
LERIELAWEALYAWQAKLGLKDWDIRITEQEPDPGYLAQVQTSPADRAAQINLCADVPLDQVEREVLHELLHIVMKPYTTPTEHLVAISGEELGVYMAHTLEDAEEVVIEQIVRAFGFPHLATWGEAAKSWSAFELVPHG